MPLRLATRAMGTRFELVLAAESRDARSAGTEALLEIEEWDTRLSRFRRGSWLSHLNRSAARDWVRLDPELLSLFELCERVHALSHGTFDPSVAPVMDALASGYHPRALERARSRVGWHRVELDASRCAVRFREPGVSLDLGGVAKGFALDRAGERLRELGVQCALLHGGTSTTIAIGHPPGADAWRVALAEPRSPSGDACHDIDSDTTPRVTAALRDCALSVSAQSGRTFFLHGRSIGHVVDPVRTSQVEAAPELAAVICRDAAAADAWSTALLLRGAEPSPAEATSTAIARRGPGSRREWRLSGWPPAFELLTPSTSAV